MNVWNTWPFFLLFFLSASSSSSPEDDTVAENIGVHQLERLVELLTSNECEDLLFALSHPEENIFERLERLSPERNDLHLKPRAKREASFAAQLAELLAATLTVNLSGGGPYVVRFPGNEARCRTALTDWLLRYGEQTYYDRLSRALQHIGRTDIAIEVGKNINQETLLNLKRYVEDYHKYVQSLNIPPVESDSRDGQRERRTAGKRKARDLDWRNLDLIVERPPLPPYTRGPLDVALPVLYGILLGFGGTLLMGASVLLLVLRLSREETSAASPAAPTI